MAIDLIAERAKPIPRRAGRRRASSCGRPSKAAPSAEGAAAGGEASCGRPGPGRGAGAGKLRTADASASEIADRAELASVWRNPAGEAKQSEDYEPTCSNGRRADLAR